MIRLCVFPRSHQYSSRFFAYRSITTVGYFRFLAIMRFQRTLFLISCVVFIAAAAPNIESSPRGLLGGLLGKNKAPDCVCPKPAPQPVPIGQLTRNSNLLTQTSFGVMHLPSLDGSKSRSLPSNSLTETVSTNNCSTGTPYCCSGDNVKGMVCGPASSTNCNTLTICCINTNGVGNIPESKGKLIDESFRCNSVQGISIFQAQ